MVVGFNAFKGSIEHFPAWNDDDIEPRSHLPAPKHLAGQALGAIPIDRRPELPGGRDSKPRRRPPVRQHKQRHEAAVHPRALFVDALEFWSSTDALGGGQRLAAHAGLRRLSFVGDGQPLATLRPAPLEHDPAVLGRHSDPKTVGLLPAAGVRLEGALAFHAGPCRWPRRSTTRGSSAGWSVCRASVRGTFNTSRRSSEVSTHTRGVADPGLGTAARRQPSASRGVLHSPVRPSGVSVCRRAGSVSSPSFPHLWKTLWKTGPSGWYDAEIGLFLGTFAWAKANWIRFLVIFWA